MSDISIRNQQITNNAGVSRPNFEPTPKSTINTKDSLVKGEGDTKSIGQDLKAFASTIKQKTTEVGADITGSDNNTMNCSIGLGMAVAGSVLGLGSLVAVGAILTFASILPAVSGFAKTIDASLIGKPYSNEEAQAIKDKGINTGIML